jgi:anti-sigma factor RsiW
MHTCKDAIDLLRAYLDGELTAHDQQALEEHLGSCAPCVDFVATYRQTPGLCKKALQAKMPKDLADSLSAFLRKHTAA